MIEKNTFQLDQALKSSCFTLLNWPLSAILLKNNSHYPWLILVPRRVNMTKITQLSQADRYQLTDEIYHATLVMQKQFKPDKINTGLLGNIVSQLHIHVIARFKTDHCWPYGVWQPALEEKPYDEPNAFISSLTNQLSKVKF